MREKWFTPWGLISRQVSIEGAALVGLAVIFCAQVFIAIDRHSHSVSDTLYGIFPYVVPCFMMLNWVASKASGVAQR